MNDKLIFGAAYYAEYMPYERTKEDLKMMKEAGMNTIRIAESTWSTLEPTEGSFDFSYLDHVLEVAAEYEMQVIIGTPTYAIPAWMVRKEPEVMVERKNGRTHYGHRQLMDLVNPNFLFYAERVIRTLLGHTAGHPCVIGFQIDNETKHYNGYSREVQRQFVEYLKEKYQTTDCLNQTFYLAYWSNSIHSWEDFPDMKGCIHAGLCAEYDRFRRNLVTKYLAWQAKLVREYAKPEQFVTHNLDFEWKKFGADIAQDGYSYGVQPDVEHADVGKLLDLAGTDIYHPTQDDLTGAEIAFGGDEIRSIKQENYLVLENQAQAFKYWTPYKGQLRLHAYSHLASGAMGTMYWNWHSIHNGYETYWKGVLSHDLAKNPVYHEAKLFGNEWKTLGRNKLAIRKNNKVALLIDNSSLSALQWFPIDKDLSYNDVVRYLYDSLYEMNVECDVIFAEELETKNYQMIVVPALYCAEESLIEKLKEFVEQGGVLISSFRSFVADKNCNVYTDTQPHGLDKVFGVSYQQSTEPGKTTVRGEKVTYFADLLVAKEATVIAYYEHPYWKEYAAITKHHYGKGTAFYLGCYSDPKIVKDIYRDALKEAGISNFGIEAPIIIRSGSNQEGRKIHYVLHFSEEKRTFSCPYETVTDLLTGMSYQKGDSIPLKDWDVLILEERERRDL